MPAHGVGRLAASLRRERLAQGEPGARRTTLWAILAAAIVIFCIAAWPFTRAHLQAVAVLREVSGQPVPWIARGVTSPVTTEDFSFAIESSSGPQSVRARMYTPQGKPNAPAMAIFHGVHHLGIDEPRLMGFAAAMARWPNSEIARSARLF